MRFLYLILLSLLPTINSFAYDVSGIAVNSETGDPLSGFDILLVYPSGGVAGDAVTNSNGIFTITGISNGTYGLEFYTYPDPIIISGDYFVRTIYDGQVEVNGGNITGLEFSISPHHPDYVLTGALLDAVTNDTITIQDFQVQMKMKYYTKFFIDYATENGTYILENLPDYTYEFTLFENDYFEGISTEITIDSIGPDTVKMDFYLEPKTGATVSGVLLDSVTNQPIMQEGRTIKLQAINSIFTQTNDQGEFTFINVPPGTYANISVASQDTNYFNCNGSEITGFSVPEQGLENVQLFQKPWVSIHKVTSESYTFEPGETKTIKFSITNDDLNYGAIWGVQLQFPDGVTVISSTPFYSEQTGGTIFDKLPDCSSDMKKDWEGWHWVGIPPYASSEGNLDELNESAWAEITIEFPDSVTMETAPVFYEIFYEIHCFNIQPFSYGTIMLENEKISGNEEYLAGENSIRSYPNPAVDKASIEISLDQTSKGDLLLYTLSGQPLINLQNKVFKKGITTTTLNVSSFDAGIYYYVFTTNNLRLTGKLVVSRY